MEEKEIIATCYRQMYEGMVKKNRKLLSEVLDDSFALIHMTGMRQAKEAFIKAIENGTLNYYAASHEDIEVWLHGDRAELTGQSKVTAAVFGGGKHTWRLQLDLELVRKNNTWKITSAEASTY